MVKKQQQLQESFTFPKKWTSLFRAFRWLTVGWRICLFLATKGNTPERTHRRPIDHRTQNTRKQEHPLAPKGTTLSTTHPPKKGRSENHSKTPPARAAGDRAAIFLPAENEGGHCHCGAHRPSWPFSGCPGDPETKRRGFGAAGRTWWGFWGLQGFWVWAFCVGFGGWFKLLLLCAFHWFLWGLGSGRVSLWVSCFCGVWDLVRFLFGYDVHTAYFWEIWKK